MSKHTPEPWESDRFLRLPIAFPELSEPVIMVVMRPDDFERAMQCVNACAGMHNPEDVIRFMKSVKIDPHGKPDFGSVISEMEQLKSEIARLRDALEAIANGVAPSNDKEAWMWISTARLEANTALKGGPHETI